MRILVGIGHPAHVHFYKNAVWRMLERGDEVLLAARNKDVTLDLLDAYQLPYEVISSVGRGRRGMISEYLRREWSYSKLIRSFKPDAVTEIGGLFAAPIGQLLRVPTLVFTDTETVRLDRVLTYPLASAIYTPDSFMNDLGKKQVRYAGFHELAYLHPSWFDPEPSVLEQLGVEHGERFVVLRYVAWQASHDIGHQGMSTRFQEEAVYAFEEFGRVFITSETDLPGKLRQYQIEVRPEQIHDVLYYASLFFGEGATMAAEAGILGTPSVYVSPFAVRLGYIAELQNRFGLIAAYTDPQQALLEAAELMKSGNIESSWKLKQQQLLEQKIDVTEWILDSVFTDKNLTRLT